MRTIEPLARLILIALLALPLGVQGLGAQTGYGLSGHGDDGLGETGDDPLCWRGCSEDPGLIRTRIWESGSLTESILTGPPGDETAARAAVEDAGGQVLRRSEQRALGQVSLIAVFPGDAARSRALARLARTAPATGMSMNWTYTHAQATSQAAGPRLYAPVLIGDERPGRCRLAAPLRIGMIDGPLNPRHPALRRARVNYTTLIGDAAPSPADHGTAVAALIVGEDPTGALAGFARGAELHAVAVFSRQDARDESSVERIVQALDLLVSRDVRLINISIAGPRSPALQRAISAAAARGVVMVAASGNDGVQQVAFPAEAREVIAVTAVDSIKRRYRLANFGYEIEFSAPGVDVYTALANGGGYGSGTSFATPIVTALIAREMARGVAGDSTLRARLRAGAEALGDGQRNPEFGYGLVRASNC